MNKDAITIFVVDDNIPKTSKFVEEDVYNSAISTFELAQLVHEIKEWKGEQNLQELLRYILSHRLTTEEKIILKGFTHPEICLEHIEKVEKPDIVIYDWEYGSEHNNNSSSWLKEILEFTSAFVFVYSGVRHFIPPHLNKDEFNTYSDRFQLFGKGGNNNSLFSSEEFILQYLLSRIQSDNEIRLQGINIEFTSSGYLKQAQDILYLENIFDRAYILEQIKDGINEDSLKKLFDSIENKILLDPTRNFLMTDDSELIVKKFNPTESLSYGQVVLKYGISILEETLKRGLVKV